MIYFESERLLKQTRVHVLLLKEHKDLYIKTAVT